MLNHRHEAAGRPRRYPAAVRLRRLFFVTAAALSFAPAIPSHAQEAESGGTPVPPDEIRYESSVGTVLFPHDRHVRMRCTRCHHQIHADVLDTPHEGYLDASRINCGTCHDGNAERTRSDYRCSACHHAEPRSIADETLSSKVVLHQSCWKCHKTGTGAKASAGCGECHLKEAETTEASTEAALH